MSDSRGPLPITMRGAFASDLPFLQKMLYEAVCWRTENTHPPLEAILAEPDIGKLLHQWEQRQGDIGVVANLLEGQPVGAAWCRYWSDSDHSYGFVAPDVPELAIGVAIEWRGRGVGRALMNRLIETAQKEGAERISLSVEMENPAQHLYRDLGFREVDDNGNAWTMIRDLV